MNDNSNDDDLKALLHETAAGITPLGSFEEIRTRITGNGPRRWVLPTIAAAAATILVLGGVGLVLRNNDNRTAQPSGHTTDAPIVTRDVKVFYVGDAAAGPRLFSESVPIRAEDTPTTFGLKAAQDVVGRKPSDLDFHSAWPAGIEVRGFGHDTSAGHPESLSVVFSETSNLTRPAGMTDAEAHLALEQMVRTVQAASGLTLPVYFEQEATMPDGSVGASSVGPLTVLGINLTGPVAAGDDSSVLAPVQITSLINGQTVPAGPVKIEGVAATFEANVVWEILVGGDAVVMNGHTTARECCTLSPYSFTVNLQPGTYTIVVHDTDESGTGRPVNQDSKEITVE